MPSQDRVEQHRREHAEQEAKKQQEPPAPQPTSK